MSASFDYLQPALLLAVPLLYALAAMPANWRIARICTALAVGLGAASLALLAFKGSVISYSVRADALGCIVLLLVTFIGWVITRYSQAYLGGDTGQVRYTRWLMATLAAVSVVVVTNNLAVMALAYPLWSWCRLEASLAAMAQETTRIATLPRPRSGTAWRW